ncbi:MAG: tRNA uridine-5-carboxymethylaminomethyl(34) synthesis GTPase MnmE, partial [Erysipelotrichaceae bacterium]|nr:tRNA uridine-5-carboxymethylaminomethyl(34) synthesis GTPase MnmE [Erysipelotrichaceae bacterium]
LKETEGYNRIVVYNKKDLVDKELPLGISAATSDISSLVDAINEMFESSQLALKQPALTNERQIALMREARTSMLSVKDSLDQGIPLDLVNEDMQNAYRCLREILGEYHREDLLDGIFSRFCVGK